MLGYWAERHRKFIERAANANLTMMHARWATCGKKTVEEAHPFAIKRRGRIVLYGVHNGRVYNAYNSARTHGRTITVDSEEIFELLADNDFDGIRKLEGYGVITWIDVDNPSVIKLLRLSEDSEIYVVETPDNKVVYGSTPDIVHAALKDAGVVFQDWMIIDVGTVYNLTSSGVFYTEINDLKFKEQEVIDTDKTDWYEKWLRSIKNYDDSKTKRKGKKKSRKSSESTNSKDHSQSTGISDNQDYIDLDELFELECENCGDTIEAEDFEELSVLYESNKPIASTYCKDCIMPVTGE